MADDGYWKREQTAMGRLVNNVIDTEPNANIALPPDDDYRDEVRPHAPKNNWEGHGMSVAATRDPSPYRIDAWSCGRCRR